VEQFISNTTGATSGAVYQLDDGFR
jgi:hypothetical protein